MQAVHPLQPGDGLNARHIQILQSAWQERLGWDAALVSGAKRVLVAQRFQNRTASDAPNIGCRSAFSSDFCGRTDVEVKSLGGVAAIDIRRRPWNSFVRFA
jgi:hypothetical protein